MFALDELTCVVADEAVCCCVCVIVIVIVIAVAVAD